MPATQPSKDLRPLCYEHHREMALHPDFLRTGSGRTQPPVYGCTVLDCPIQYNTALGYFTLKQNGNPELKIDVPAIVPHPQCPLDRSPMYLAETNPGIRNYRLWICPQCGAQRTNEAGLVGLPSQDTQDPAKNSPGARTSHK